MGRQHDSSLDRQGIYIPPLQFSLAMGNEKWPLLINVESFKWKETGDFKLPEQIMTVNPWNKFWRLMPCFKRTSGGCSEGAHLISLISPVDFAHVVFSSHIASAARPLFFLAGFGVNMLQQKTHLLVQRETRLSFPASWGRICFFFGGYSKEQKTCCHDVSCLFPMWRMHHHGPLWGQF